jgi:hypothetical protein
MLAAAAIYLQPPTFDFRQEPYDNPQYFKPLNADLMEDLLEGAATSFESPIPGHYGMNHEELTLADLFQAIDHTAVPAYLKQRETHSSIRTDLARSMIFDQFSIKHRC